jgi:hypothetical protein
MNGDASCGSVHELSDDAGLAFPAVAQRGQDGLQLVGCDGKQ